MKAHFQGVRRKLTGKIKQLAYSSPVRDFARKVATAESAEPLRQIVERNGMEDRLRRFTSETLPNGKYFAKLTIHNWEDFNGQSFRLYHGESIVYGNQIEPPAKGHPLEYRNIIVSSPDATKFLLDIDSPYTLTIGRGAFTTPQQIDYDKKYHVEQHGDVFYSLRGNLQHPKKLLITFPGFGPSTSRISYAVSYLKAISDADLSETLMVCFQDRYLAAGSYMLVDNAGRPLQGRINAVIDQLIEKYRIAGDQIMFFGASKGGSIAIQYAENHPKAHLVVAVPQMNIRYYLDKPFFRDNLFREVHMHSLVQPEQLIRSYFREGRRIDYFYTNSDEQSNYSLIEMVGKVPGLTKYRINGRHGDVARASLPTTLGIIHRFLGTARDLPSHVEVVNTYQSGNSLGVQVRVDDISIPLTGVNWYLSGSIGHTRFRQILTQHSLPFVKYTADSQRLMPIIDDLAGLDTVVACAENGDQWTAALPESAKLHLDGIERQELPTDRLRLETSGRTPYAILQDNNVSLFSYDSRRGIGDADRIEIHIVVDVDSFDISEERHRTDARFVSAVETSPNEDLLTLITQRLHVASNCSRVKVFRHDQEDRATDESCFEGESEDVAVVAEV